MKDLIPGFGRGRSMAFVIVAITFGSLFAFTTRANTTWTVTVDVSKGTDIPTYDINPKNTPNCVGSPPAGDPSKGDVQICPGDAIYWTFVTKGKKGWLTVHQNSGVLKDMTSNPIYWFHKKERDTQNPGGTTLSTEPDNIFTYCVAVHDNNGTLTHLYTHDPKIIVGKGSPLQLLNDIQHDCSRL